MDIETIKTQQYVEMRVTGRFDAQWAGELDSQLAAAIRSGARDLRLDMSGIVFMSSAGIRILLKHYRELKAIRGRFGILRPSAQVAEVLAMTGLLTSLRLDPDSAEEVAAGSTPEASATPGKPASTAPIPLTEDLDAETPRSAASPAPDNVASPPQAGRPSVDTASSSEQEVLPLPAWAGTAPEVAPAAAPETAAKAAAGTAPEVAPRASPETAARAAAGQTLVPPLQGGRIDAEAPLPGSGLTLSLIGDPERFQTLSFGEKDLATISARAATMAIGLGAFGAGFAECADYFGEFLVAGGTAACIPANASAVPDYMLATGDFVPLVQSLYAVVCEGEFPHFFQFEAQSRDVPIPLSAIAGASTTMSGPGGPTALLMLAETAGLVGIHLTASPIQKGGASPWSFPEIRDRFSLTTEPAWPRSLALVAGIIADEGDAALAPFARPFGLPGKIGHFHAVALSYRALPAGRLEVSIVHELLETQTLLGVLHLLDDNRAYSGIGESRFLRGAVWTGRAHTTASSPAALAGAQGGAP